jgi:hypothetical protein
MDCVSMSKIGFDLMCNHKTEDSELAFAVAKLGPIKPNLMASANCEPRLVLCNQRSSESSTMECDPSKLNGTVFGIRDWLDYLRDQSATYRKLVNRADDPLVKTELLALASACDEIADNIQDHLTGEEDPAPRGRRAKDALH